MTDPELVMAMITAHVMEINVGVDEVLFGIDAFIDGKIDMSEFTPEVLERIKSVIVNQRIIINKLFEGFANMNDAVEGGKLNG